jgi:hypothetical protein
LVLRRLSLLQNSTIRIELADPGSASLRALATSLIPTGSGKPTRQSCRMARPAVAAIGGQPEAYEHKWFQPKSLRTSSSDTCADLADIPLPTELIGPTFAKTRQEAEARRLEQEAEILRNIYDNNLQLVQGLEELRATRDLSHRGQAAHKSASTRILATNN